MLKLNRSVKRL